jgi:hypothetical protein
MVQASPYNHHAQMMTAQKYLSKKTKRLGLYGNQKQSASFYRSSGGIQKSRTSGGISQQSQSIWK